MCIRDRSNVGPGGKPDLLYAIPSTVGYNFQGIPVDQEDINVCSQVFEINHPPFWKNKALFDLFLEYMRQYNLPNGNDPETSLDNYVKIQQLLNDDNIMF